MRSLPILFTGIALPFAVHAAGDPLSTARRALEEGIPGVAVGKLRSELKKPLRDDERENASLLLARALLTAGQAAEALAVVKDLNGPEAKFLRAWSLLALGCVDEARGLFEELRNPAEQDRLEEAMRPMVFYGLAECDPAKSSAHEFATDSPVLSLRQAEQMLDRGDSDWDAIARKIDGADAAAGSDASTALLQKYLRARLALARHEFGRAISSFEELLSSPVPLPAGIAAGATLGLAEARAAVGGGESADDVLEDFIARNPRNPHLARLFAKLDQIYETEENPPDAALNKWAKDKESERTALARFYLAKMDLRENKPERAAKRLAGFTQDYPRHPLALEAHLIRARLLAADKKGVEALAACEAAMRSAKNNDERAAAEMAAGVLQFQDGDYVLAGNSFESAASRSWIWRERAIFNSALSWLAQGNFGKFAEDVARLEQDFPGQPLGKSLLLEKGLWLARTGAPGAEATLKQFIADHPDHPRAQEARLALAEVAFLDPMPRLAEASEYRRAANDAAPTGPVAERSEYLAIFLADAEEKRNEQGAIKMAKEFLASHPDSALRGEVHMKLGEIYFRGENYASAQTEFQLLVEENPASPLAEVAEFLAGQSAMRSMSEQGILNALDLFERVAKRNGPLKHAARQQQAIAKTRLGRNADAVVIYDSILGAEPPPEMRRAALAGKGDVLMVLGANDAKKYLEAIEAFDRLAKDEEAGATWRNQALYKKAKCLEKLERSSEAIAVLYDVIEAQAQPNQQPEFFWTYKAGFDAAQILEAQQDWKSAIGIYGKLAPIQGPRADEAKASATRLKLEHFIWEE